MGFGLQSISLWLKMSSTGLAENIVKEALTITAMLANALNSIITSEKKVIDQKISLVYNDFLFSCSFPFTFALFSNLHVHTTCIGVGQGAMHASELVIGIV